MKKWLLWLSLMGLVFYVALEWNDYNQVKIVFCDVGQGDGFLVEKQNTQFLFDVGSANQKMLGCLADNIPFWDRQIEAIVVSHWDEDHCGALGEIDDYYQIKKLWSGVKAKDGFEQFNYADILNKGDRLTNSWLDFEVLWPDKKVRLNEKRIDVSNYYSVVALLKVVGKKVLLTGDAPQQVEQRLVWRGDLNEEVDILKVSHHGSATGTSQDLLEVIKPKMAVVGVGKNNYGHPTKEVLDRLKRADIEIRRTDMMGNVILRQGKEW
ncbi:hypothetical protein DRH14_00285 [Candidatus Shapirobacteria bacterium]|nr:MAG: hypothetical protein DRH14_00285 [Candidatus Shapirobacteria bacterium]